MLEPGASTHTQLLRYFSPRRRLNRNAFRSDTVSGDTDDTYNYRKIVPVCTTRWARSRSPNNTYGISPHATVKANGACTIYCTICHMHARHPRVCSRTVYTAWSFPCRCVCLEPGYKSLITPPFRDIAGIYALCTWALCVYMRHITRGGVYN